MNMRRTPAPASPEWADLYRDNLQEKYWACYLLPNITQDNYKATMIARFETSNEDMLITASHSICYRDVKRFI